MIYMGISKEGTSYERKVYDLLGLFGDVGGLVEVFDYVCMFIVSILCTNMLEAKSVSMFFKCHF